MSQISTSIAAKHFLIREFEGRLRVRFELARDIYNGGRGTIAGSKKT